MTTFIFRTISLSAAAPSAASITLLDQKFRPIGYKRGKPGKLSSPAQIAHGLHLLQLRRKAIQETGFEPPELTFDAIARKIGVFAASTVCRWDHKDMSGEAILLRQNLKKREPKFTVEEEKILAGWCVYKDLTMESSTTTSFNVFTMTFFRRTVSPSYFTRFMKRYHLSLKQVGNASPNEQLQSTINEGIQFLRVFADMVSLYGIRLDQIKSLDKTYLMTSPWHKQVKHIGPSGSNKSRKQTSDRGPGKNFSLQYWSRFFSSSFLLIIS